MPRVTRTDAVNPAKPNTGKKPARKSATVAHPVPVEVIENIQDEIQQRAYELWEESNHEDGRAMEHWLRAEAEVLARRNQRSA